MSEQAPTKDQVSLDDLKRAIDQYQALKSKWGNGEAADLYEAEIDAWRTAFEWHTSLARRARTDFSQSLQELADGMALIRGKLQ